MKKMTCTQLGGACDKEFRAASFDEMANLSKQHAMDMIQKKDVAHLRAMDHMRDLMKDSARMSLWFESKKQEFDALPEE